MAAATTEELEGHRVEFVGAETTPRRIIFLVDGQRVAIQQGQDAYGAFWAWEVAPLRPLPNSDNTEHHEDCVAVLRRFREAGIHAVEQYVFEIEQLKKEAIHGTR